MNKIIKEMNEEYSKCSFTLQYVFNIKLSEYSDLATERDLIGVIIDIQNNLKQYYYYLGQLFTNENEDLSYNIFLKMINKEKYLNKIIEMNNNCLIENIPDNQCGQIFVFKIYMLNTKK